MVERQNKRIAGSPRNLVIKKWAAPAAAKKTTLRPEMETGGPIKNKILKERASDPITALTTKSQLKPTIKLKGPRLRCSYSCKYWFPRSISAQLLLNAGPITFGS